MDPVTLAILAASAGAATGALPSLLPSKAHRSNKNRLEELEALEASGQLGLTGKEQASMGNKLRGGQLAAQEQSEDFQSAMLAGGGMATGGQALARAAEAQQQRMAVESDVAAKVLDADLLKQQEQRDEMRALEAAVEEKRNERVQAVANIAGSAVSAGIGSAGQQAIIQGQKDISPEQASALAKQLGVSEEEARGIWELSITNPEILKYQTLMAGDKR